MSAPVCAVTGANGFVGKAILRWLQMHGHRTVALTHRPGTIAGVETRPFTLGEIVPPDTLKGVDVLIHTAYDFSVRSWADICRINVIGSEYLFDAARRVGVKRLIFISSMSAFEGCRSLYGRGKLAAEDSARIRGGLSIRPGMIFSEENGGMAAKIAKVARRFPVIPMIGNGKYPLYTCHVEDLCGLVTHFIDAKDFPNEIVTAANDKPVTLLDVALAASDGKPRIVFAIPWSWVALALWLLECIGLRPGFRSDSVVSLVNANPAPNFELLKKFPVKFRAFFSENS